MQKQYHYIEKAIQYIRDNFKSQPSLEEIANHVGLSPFHFQRTFEEWAGVSPKKFLQFLTLEYAKELLQKQDTLLNVAHDAGLSGTGRLHDLFVTVEGMTPGEYKNGAAGLRIEYEFYDSIFGTVLIASTASGICYTAFADDETFTLGELKELFPKAAYIQQESPLHKTVLSVFTNQKTSLTEIKLHLKGTEFQLKVWNALLQIPSGNLSTYSQLAETIHHPKASRAVGSAIGANPIAFLIPCHRVIRNTGETGQYHWGSARKQAIIGWERSVLSVSLES